MGLKDKLDQAMAGDEIDLDFSQARDQDFGDIDPGEYEFEVIKAESGVSGKGNPKAVFQLKIVDEGKFLGRIMFKHAPTKGEGAGIFREVWRACGFDVDVKKVKLSDSIGKHVLGTVRFQKDSDEFQELTKLKPVKSGAKAGRSSRLS